jgi:hypothetical protein
MRARIPWLGGGMLALAVMAWPCTAVVRAQNAPLPAAPVPIASPAPAVVPAPAPALGTPVPFAPPAAPTPLTYTPPPPPAPAPPVDPGPNGWGPYEPPSVPEGYFFAAEIELLYPVLKDRITNDSVVLPSGNQLRVPSTSLDLTVAPKIEFSYRLPDSAGLFAASFRFFSASGDGSQIYGGTVVGVHTGLALETLDLDYGTTMFEVAPRWFIDWRIGLRLSDIYFDSSVRSVPFVQQSSDYLIGTGPHARLDAQRSLELVHGLSLFGSVDGAVLIGQIKQDFRELVTQPDGSTVYSSVFPRHTQSVPTLALQAGLTFVPPIFTNFKITTGYQFEAYWYLGQFGLVPPNNMLSGSRGELFTHGWFLRGQYDF